jgi:hypothetical protein
MQLAMTVRLVAFVTRHRLVVSENKYIAEKRLLFLLISTYRNANLATLFTISVYL